jgi:hypothetical protein
MYRYEDFDSGIGGERGKGVERIELGSGSPAAPRLPSKPPNLGA